MREWLTELIGTFFLVLTIGLTVLGQSPFAPLAIGASLMAMVYMGGHVSGGHYNPAVSLAVALRGRLPFAQLIPYWLAQIAGAVLAALAVHAIVGRTFAPAPSAGPVAALLVEFLFTLALALVVLQSATSDATKGNSFYGLAIGFTVVVAAFAGGAHSGGAFNPAVGLGPTIVNTLMGGGSLQHVWLYVVGPLAGGLAAAMLFGLQER